MMLPASLKRMVFEMEWLCRHGQCVNDLLQPACSEAGFVCARAMLAPGQKNSASEEAGYSKRACNAAFAGV
jgi:hypothetical protein